MSSENFSESIRNDNGGKGSVVSHDELVLINNSNSDWVAVMAALVMIMVVDV